jgi:hypothetical protein
MRSKVTLFLFCLLSALQLFSSEDVAAIDLEGQEIEINLKNPLFTQGIIKTDQGGVITSKDLRIQAEQIEYTNRVENGILIKKIVAEGNLLFEHNHRAFVGKRLEYDFINHSGTLWEGRTFTGIWFIGGDRIDLKPDGTYALYNAFITTSENHDSTWDIHAHAVKVTKDHLLSASSIRFRFIKIPIFWLPSFKMNLKVFADPPVKYKLRWDKKLGPRATIRYRVYSWEDFNLFARLDYRLKRGFGAAIESEYYSQDERVVFLTKSYGANDKTVPDEKGPHRYRLQGLYEWQSLDDKTHIYASYDKISDDKMPSDFKGDDFEVNTQKRSIFILDHTEVNSLSNVVIQPHLNNFQSLNQELPLAFGTIRPFNLGRSGIISENYATGGYLNYVYNHQIKKFLPHIHAGRFETKNQFYRPVPFKSFTLTPRLGFIGIYYTNNQHHRSVGQAILSYGAEANSRLLRAFGTHKHIIEPYFNYLGLSRPTAGLKEHFIFGMEDGYTQLNQIRFGIKNTLFSSRLSPFKPQFVADLYTYAFFGRTRFHRTIPKLYAAFGWNRPSFAIKAGCAWNLQESLLDYSNILTEWTVSEDLAFALEFRHRSRFDWRKADHENFILDVARPIEQLLHSPLSDGRNTFLTRFHFRLSPKWTCHIESHHGWGRKNQPRYDEYKIELFNVITTSWQLRIAFKKTTNDIEFSPSLSIVK